jgi:hypothetical protein
LVVSRRDNVPVGSHAVTALRLEAEQRRLSLPLDRPTVIFNLGRAADAAEAGNATGAILSLARIVEPEVACRTPST